MADDMMVVQMTINMSGGRHDGRDWPPAWTDFEVPVWEGHDLCRGGLARFVRMSGIMVLPGLAEENAVVSGPARTAAGPLSTETRKPDWGTDEAAELAEVPEPPRPAAPKQEWIDWAVSRGADEDTVGMLTKQQLMETYGGRA